MSVPGYGPFHVFAIGALDAKEVIDWDILICWKL